MDYSGFIQIFDQISSLVGSMVIISAVYLLLVYLVIMLKNFMISSTNANFGRSHCIIVLPPESNWCKFKKEDDEPVKTRKSSAIDYPLARSSSRFR